MSTILHVLRKPSADTLSRIVAHDSAKEPALPEGWTRCTQAEHDAWVSAEKAGGWLPVYPEVSSVPEAVSRRQLKEWLIRAELIDTVEAIIGGIQDATEKRIAQNWWTESIEFRRDHPLVAAIAQQIGKSSAEVDAIFQEAAAL